MTFIPQKSDNKRFLEDYLKVETVFNKDTNKNHEIVTGLLLDGKHFREDQKNNCVYVPENEAEAELQFLKMQDVSAEDLDSLIKQYETRIQEVKEFYNTHDWDGETWQPEPELPYPSCEFFPQVTDTYTFLQDQLDLYKAGRAYHQSIKSELKKIKDHIYMDDILKNIEIKTKIIAWYDKRIKAMDELLISYFYNS